MGFLRVTTTHCGVPPARLRYFGTTVRSGGGNQLRERKELHIRYPTQPFDVSRACRPTRLVEFRRLYPEKRSQQKDSLYANGSCVRACVCLIVFSYFVIQAPVVVRDADGVMRGATVDEEKGLSYADENLFRRDVRRWSALREMA